MGPLYEILYSYKELLAPNTYYIQDTTGLDMHKGVTGNFQLNNFLHLQQNTCEVCCCTATGKH